MNILLISQCEKRALTETRRILDQFAERRGDRTWQTPITQAGLQTLRKLLRKTARKNTAVACYWIRGTDHSELMWIVGDAGRFNAEGAVPTNTTERNVLRRDDENDWHTLEDIRLLAQMAALLHDLGKAVIAFQERLKGTRSERNLYRHEWVSVRLFLAFVQGADDEGWLRRLADPDAFDEQFWIAPGRYQRDGLDAVDRHPFCGVPPLAAAIAWLVVTHHRLPLVPAHKDGVQQWLGKRSRAFNSDWLEAPLPLIAHDWNEVLVLAERQRIEPYWNLAGPLPVVEPSWRAQAARLAKRLLDLRTRRAVRGLDDPYVMHLARLSLMLADHHYSSLPRESPQRIKGDGNTRLHANTDSDGKPKQFLDEHLLGVARGAGMIVHALPSFARALPRLAHHRGLRKRSADPRFSWQDKAADAAAALRDAAREHGAFIVNMASTGCGKTLANARILYALADPQRGMRATYALGLRTLTLQTGRSFRADLHLGEDELAIRVGGSASRALFEHYERQAEDRGSASAQHLIEEDSHVLYDGATSDHPLLSRALHDPEIRNLLSAPILVCTIDHIVPATEALRAGRQIAPMLRLMSADLILDELDDYDLDDLPALTRLVHWAGMLGTRVVLSSATLPPALVEGMFLAYRAGRRHYRANRGVTAAPSAEGIEVPCLWADEFGAQVATCAEGAGFAAEHAQFVEKRAGRLKKSKPLRRAELRALDIPKSQPKAAIRTEFARHVRDACMDLHADHAELDPVSGKRVSFGIVRMANIEPLFDVAQALIALGAPEDTRIHLCVYHARFPLVQRSAIEHLLDTTFNRRHDDQAVYLLPTVRAALDVHPEHDHLFVVLASPVCEVGRDWCADWAVAEPSSMRSLIQLAGRVRRHRARPVDKPNVLVFDRNLRALERPDPKDGVPAPVFIRPGFERNDEDHRFRLRSVRLDRLLAPDEYRTLNALPRIRPRSESDWSSRERFVDLEQARIAAAMLPRSRLPASIAVAEGAPMARDEATWSWRYVQTGLTGVLSQQQPFREDTTRKATLVFLPDEDEEGLVLKRIERSGARRDDDVYVNVDRSLRDDVVLTLGDRIEVWGRFDLMTLLIEQAEALDMPLERAAKKFGVVEVLENTQGWRWHSWLGFAKAK